MGFARTGMNRWGTAMPVLLAGLISAGCGTNTTMDDDAYRSIGQQAPRQSRNYAATEVDSQTLQNGVKDGMQYGGTGSRPGQSKAQSLPDFPGAAPSVRWPDKSEPNAGRHQVVRYGHPGIVDKIVRIARIHCQPLQYQISTQDNSFWGEADGTLTQCTYRFPEFCGAHTFSILSYAKKRVLVYKPKDGTHYVIDSLKGTAKSGPGLWDQDDHIGSSTTNAGYFFGGNYNQPQDQFNPANLGWIIKASYQDEAVFGQQYHKAVSEVTRCF